MSFSNIIHKFAPDLHLLVDSAMKSRMADFLIFPAETEGV